MKKSFETPKINLIYLGTDVICTSDKRDTTSSNTEGTKGFYQFGNEKSGYDSENNTFYAG